MNSRYIFDVIKLFLLAGLVMLMNHSIAHADSCFHEFMLKQFDDPLSVVLKRTDSIFIGEATSKRKVTLESKGNDPITLEELVNFNVSEIVLGDSMEASVIKSISEDCSCKYNFEIGQKYLVFASKKNDAKDGMRMYFCGYIKQADTKEAADLIKLVKTKIKKSKKINGVCGRARSIIPTGVNPVPAREVTHRVAIIGQAEVTPNVKHDVRKAAGRKRKLK